MKCGMAENKMLRMLEFLVAQLWSTRQEQIGQNGKRNQEDESNWFWRRN